MAKQTPSKASPGQKSLLSFFSKSPKPTPGKHPIKSESRLVVEPKSEESAPTPPSSKATQLPSPLLPSSPLASKSRRIEVDSDSEDDDDIVLPRPKREKLDTQQQGDAEDTFVENTIPTSEPEVKDEAMPVVTGDAEGGTRVNSAPSSLDKFSSDSAYSAPALVKRPKATATVPEGRYHWVLNPRDADGNSPSDPNYDPRTINIPSSAWAKFTAFEKQYWEIKGKLWDTIVFFKKGKFYELYEKDALIGHAEFDLRLAGGGRANMQCAGIPEMSFDYWASAFIAKGFKVAKVDQKETALAKEMRDNSAGKKEEKIIKRELSFILTAGTLTDESMLVDDLSQFCMAIKQSGTKFSVAFVDTSTAAFFLTEIEDDEDLNHFETLMAQTRPRELILERGNLSRYAEKIIRNNSSVDTLWNIFKPEEEFLDSDTALHELAIGKYFGEDIDSTEQYPAVLKDSCGSEALMSAFGALLHYLKALKLDQQLVSLGNFKEYEPVQRGGPMVLDGQTLQNLEIFANTYDQSTEGTLFWLINKCLSPFGKRRLKSWISHPLKDIAQIEARQDVVDLLLNQMPLREYIEGKLTGMADVERMLSRVHAGSLPPRDFVRLIHAIEEMNSLRKFILSQGLTGLIADLFEPLPDLEMQINEWLEAFDHAKAASENILVPEPGVEPGFDQTHNVIKELEAELENCIKGYRKQFKSHAICYKDSGKEIYLIELPSKLKVPDDWQQMAATKQVKRYWSPEVRKLVRQLQEARERHKIACDLVQVKLYQKFNLEYASWLALTQKVADLDCLVSLARTTLQMPTHCRPQFKDSSCRTHIKFTGLTHPCNTQFIPNDIELGGDAAKMSLLTGANAAGKSTVLRSAGCAVILAQMGCHVPATSAELSPIDRIMTRLGANDNIFAGKSTFHVELSETQRILSEATSHSLVVIDELGRGGSSSDGFAIAEAVLHHLATHIGCLGFFATHYGTLIKSFEVHPEVKPERMAILCDQESREVTFLYKLEAGSSEGSFGMNVAAMCGVDKSIIDTAEKAAQTYEHTQRLNKLGYQGMPIGLQSDVVWALKEVFGADATRTMVSMVNALSK